MIYVLALWTAADMGLWLRDRKRIRVQEILYVLFFSCCLIFYIPKAGVTFAYAMKSAAAVLLFWSWASRRAHRWFVGKLGMRALIWNRLRLVGVLVSVLVCAALLDVWAAPRQETTEVSLDSTAQMISIDL